jgi:rhamnosyltransferase
MQVDQVLVVANDGGQWDFVLPRQVVLAKQKSNVGLGAAYNIAVRWARTCRSKYLLLLDQDSVPAPGMVAAMRAIFNQPGLIAAAGPLWRDSRTGEDGYFLHLSRWGTYLSTPKAGEIVPVDFLISSGLLISLDAFDDIGTFDEALFIEHVDTDWTTRARAQSYMLYGVADARLDHTFGEASLSNGPPWLRRRVFIYPPERNYYLLRNSIILWWRPYVPWRWIFRDARRTIALMFFYALFVSPRLGRLHAMFRAIRDGIRML